MADDMHYATIDPCVAAAGFVEEAQTFVRREMKLLRPTAMPVGQLIGATT